MLVSLGPQNVPVPDVVGKPEADARAALSRFTVAEQNAQQFSADVAAGSVVTVLDADGNPVGAEYPELGELRLVVSVGAVPPVEGLPVGEAEAKLEEAGIKVEYDDAVFDNTVPADHVKTATWTEDPMRPGSVVVLTVSKGPDLVDVPNVVGKNMVVAIDELEAAGFEVSYELPDIFLPVATVTSQDPAEGRVERNSTVRLVGSLTL